MKPLKIQGEMFSYDFDPSFSSHWEKKSMVLLGSISGALSGPLLPENRRLEEADCAWDKLQTVTLSGD